MTVRPPDTTRPAYEPAPPRAIRRFRVAVIAGPSTGRTWDAAGERCAIGSHLSNDLVVDDPTVSRFHCELAIAGDQVRVRDFGSKNGTVAGGITIGDAAIGTGTTLALGHTKVRIEVDVERAEVAASPRTAFGGLVGATVAMRELFSQLEKVAASDVTVLIEGETGTGKEGVAEALHDASARARGKLVVVDCSAIPGTLLEAELFGYEAGAFTGATSRRIGAFEEASGGTLFLDEIGELPADLQPKLLRALEAHEIRRLGARDTIHCDIRVVAATNRDLRGEVNRGAFRADLYYRLAVVRLTLPPLRDRPADLPLLVEHLLERIGAPAATVADLTAPDYLATLAAASWPGNVRELRNHLEQCVVFGERRPPGAIQPAAPAQTIDATQSYEVARRRALDAFERSYLDQLLERTGNNITRAAREAGLNRTYFHRLLRRHRLK